MRRQLQHAGTVAGGWWPPPAWPAWPAACGWVPRAGPAAKGQQKRSVHEQFFFLQKFANSFKFFDFYFLL
jgi:hypothetical protein